MIRCYIKKIALKNILFERTKTMKTAGKNKKTAVSLYEKYRPKELAELVGQEQVVRRISTITKKGIGGRAFWISGASGIGKTSLARILAGQIADEWFIEEYDSGADFDIETIDTVSKSMHFFAAGKGGRAYIINECTGLDNG